MKRVLYSVCAAALALVLCIGTVPTAWAAEVVATAQIPVTIRMEGNILPEADTIQVDIKAVTPGAPMPQPSTAKVLCDKRENKYTFFIDYTQLGIYEYTLTVHKSEYYLSEGSVDQVYTVKVAVTNNSDYSGYVVEVGAKEAGAEEKSDIVVTNRYVDPLELKVVKKWVDKDSSRPASVSIDLMLEDQVEETLVLSRKNGWQGSFSGLDPRQNWKVKESKVPAGYTATYKFDQKNNIWYVTNTGSLIQTGQLNWPIPVLCGAGLLMIGVGIAVLLRKKEESNG